VTQVFPCKLASQRLCLLEIRCEEIMPFDSSSDDGSHLPPEALQKLLSWLDADPKRADEKYAQIRAELLTIFEAKGCNEIQRLADQTVLRVIDDLRKPNASMARPELRFEKASQKVLRNYFKRWATTKEALDRLLNWLDADAELAGRKYQQIHSALSAVFRKHGFADAEGLADEAILRVIRKLPQIQETFSGNPSLYFAGVARRICQESRRQDNFSRKVYGDYQYHQQVADLVHSQEPGDDQQERCFKLCLENLKPDDRDLLLAYYEGEKREKIDFRKFLAKRFGVTAGNLRVRRFRIYNSLVNCIEECMEQEE
jgi:RNA polymerase sigma factor (sigma-70 family)